MNQLYSKTKSKKHLILWLILIFGINVLANDSDLEIDFNDHCKNSDAYILYSYTDVSYGKSWGSYVRQISYQSKLVINNKTGVDKFAFITLSKSVCDHLKSFQIKTLKSNGTIVELDSSQVFQYRNNTEHSDLINYPIPGVEPGDTVEISYMYTERLKEYELGDFVNLFNQVPSYNIEYSVLTTPDLTVRYKTYNGFPDPQVLANDTITYCLFKKEKVKGILENQYTCLPCELPYVYYSIEEKESDIRTWKDVYNQEFNYLTQPIKLDYDKSSYYYP